MFLPRGLRELNLSGLWECRLAVLNMWCRGKLGFLQTVRGWGAVQCPQVHLKSADKLLEYLKTLRCKYINASSSCRGECSFPSTLQETASPALQSPRAGLCRTALKG